MNAGPDFVNRNPSATRTGLNLLYVGTVGRSQELSTSILCALASTEGVRLRIVGGGVDTAELKTVAAECRVRQSSSILSTRERNLPPTGTGPMPVSSSLGPLESYECTVPSKLYSLMARGIPVLGVVAGEAADIVTSTAAGEVAIPGDVTSVSAAMIRMRERVETGAEFGTNPPAGQEPREWVIRARLGCGYGSQLRAHPHTGGLVESSLPCPPACQCGFDDDVPHQR